MYPLPPAPPWFSHPCPHPPFWIGYFWRRSPRKLEAANDRATGERRGAWSEGEGRPRASPRGRARGRFAAQKLFNLLPSLRPQFEPFGVNGSSTGRVCHVIEYMNGPSWAKRRPVCGHPPPLPGLPRPAVLSPTKVDRRHACPGRARAPGVWLHSSSLSRGPSRPPASRVTISQPSAHQTRLEKKGSTGRGAAAARVWRLGETAPPARLRASHTRTQTVRASAPLRHPPTHPAPRRPPTTYPLPPPSCP